MSWESRVGIGEQKESLWVLVKVSECFAVLVIVDIGIQSHHYRADLTKLKMMRLRA
jgi:hypothetical protein